MNNKVRPIAFYLPQYHPIPENDEWWGKGFTEWTNVAKAKPLFNGHHQPNLPGELGFYDLRVSETREQQAELAKAYGIEGFAYWHYWFAGRRLLERPFQEVLESKKPDFPFCLGWANETWTGIWHGVPGKILVEQTYPGMKDYENHFQAILPAFQDKRYITVEGKPLFFVYKPLQIPDCSLFLNTWKELAEKNGLAGIYFVGHADASDDYEKIQDLGFDGIYSNRMWESVRKTIQHSFRYRLKRKLKKIGLYPSYTWSGIIAYQHVIQNFVNPKDAEKNIYPMLLPNWDNSPRSGRNSLIIKNSTPELFRRHVRDVVNIVKEKPEEHRIVFIKSWNEWAEGNYLEPDAKFGRKYLEVLKEEILTL
jgi:lipopolysaccharide biosynthesis protein